MENIYFIKQKQKLTYTIFTVSYQQEFKFWDIDRKHIQDVLNVKLEEISSNQSEVLEMLSFDKVSFNKCSYCSCWKYYQSLPNDINICKLVLFF